MEINKLDAATVKNAKPRDKKYRLGDNRKEKLMSYGPYSSNAPGCAPSTSRCVPESGKPLMFLVNLPAG
jgi:hypothetical protein